MKKETDEKTFEQLFLEIENRFDWGKIYLVMKTLDWEWWFVDEKYGIPSIGTIKQSAKKLLYDAYQSESSMTASGGFLCGYENGNLWLSFIIEEYTNGD